MELIDGKQSRGLGRMEADKDEDGSYKGQTGQGMKR